MKKNILDAIISLEPSYANEAIIVVGDDIVEDAEITWGNATPLANADIQAELDRLQAIEDNCHEPRRLEYPSIQDQLDDIFHNGIDGWKETIQAIKDKYPKE